MNYRRASKTFLASLIFILSGAFHQASFSQSNPLDKKLDKAKQLAEKDKLSEADSYLSDVLKKNPEFGEGWDYLSNIRYAEYQQSKKTPNIFGGNISVTTTGKDGKPVSAEEDSLSQKLAKMLNSMNPSQKAYNKYVYTLRKGILCAEDAYECSFTLRNLFIDPEVDTNVSKKALKYYNDAEEEFQAKNYNEAAKLYKRAIGEQPDFYKAALYLGDAYYFTKNYVEAIKSFSAAVNTFPRLIEPRKYLVDAYAKERLYDKALEEAIKGMLIYPDVSMARKLDDAAYLTGKKLAIRPTTRAVFPNKISSDSLEMDLNKYEEEDDNLPNKQWKYYTEAPDKAKGIYDEKGLIKKSALPTQAKYLEVYSWEEMLKNSDDSSLEEARKMQKLGYLDCYVLITCFHFDLYDQYNDFVLFNKAKVLEYYNKFLMPL